MNVPTAARRTHARRELYGLLAETFSFPTAGLADAVSSGSLAAAVEGLSRELPYRFQPPGGLDAALDASDLESEYIRLFDLPGQSACPLYTGVYSPLRRDAMEEVLRFYRFFGLTVAQSGTDLPDAVPTVLEFMEFLVLREQAGADVAATRAVQRDVLRRHLLPWANATHQRMPKRSPHPCYAAAVALAAHFLAADVGYLDALVGDETAPRQVDAVRR